MAYALAMKSVIDFKNGDVMLLDTLFYSLITVIILGPVLKPLMEYCGVSWGAESEIAEEKFDFES